MKTLDERKQELIIETKQTLGEMRRLVVEALAKRLIVKLLALIVSLGGIISAFVAISQNKLTQVVISCVILIIGSIILFYFTIRKVGCRNNKG